MKKLIAFVVAAVLAVGVASPASADDTTNDGARDGWDRQGPMPSPDQAKSGALAYAQVLLTPKQPRTVCVFVAGTSDKAVHYRMVKAGKRGKAYQTVIKSYPVSLWMWDVVYVTFPKSRTDRWVRAYAGGKLILNYRKRLRGKLPTRPKGAVTPSRK